jgi:hypothetical protein
VNVRPLTAEEDRRAHDTVRARATAGAIVARVPMGARVDARAMLRSICSAAGLAIGEASPRLAPLGATLRGLEWLATVAREASGGRMRVATAGALAMLSRLVTGGRYVHRTARGLEASGAPTAQSSIYPWIGAAAND